MLALLTSAYYSTPADSRLGYDAPALQLDQDNGLAPLQQHRGETVLLTFWSSVNAQSRIDNLNYDRMARRDDAAFSHISVNLDPSSGVFNAIVAIDGLNRTATYHSSQQASEELIQAWRLQDGFHSFLINPQGKIIAIDPDQQTLASIR